MSKNRRHKRVYRAPSYLSNVQVQSLSTHYFLQVNDYFTAKMSHCDEQLYVVVDRANSDDEVAKFTPTSRDVYARRVVVMPAGKDTLAARMTGPVILFSREDCLAVRVIVCKEDVYLASIRKNETRASELHKAHADDDYFIERSIERSIKNHTTKTPTFTCHKCFDCAVVYRRATCPMSKQQTVSYVRE